MKGVLAILLALPLAACGSSLHPQGPTGHSNGSLPTIQKCSRESETSLPKARNRCGALP